MTREEFNKLKVGDKIELLDRSLSRTGNICTVFSRSARGISLDPKPENRKTRIRVDNPFRLAFPIVEEEKV